MHLRDNTEVIGLLIRRGAKVTIECLYGAFIYHDFHEEYTIFSSYCGLLDAPGLLNTRVPSNFSTLKQFTQNWHVPRHLSKAIKEIESAYEN